MSVGEYHYHLFINLYISFLMFPIYVSLVCARHLGTCTKNHSVISQNQQITYTHGDQDEMKVARGPSQREKGI